MRTSGQSTSLNLAITMRRFGLALLLLAALSTALPVPKEKNGKKDHDAAPLKPMSEERKVEYKRYLDELMNELGGDPELRRELEKMTPEELSKLMELPGGRKDERTPEEEEWRDEVDEQRRLQRHRFDRENEVDERPDGLQLGNLPNDEKDMDRLLREQNEKMEESERRRHREFVDMEMKREHERRAQLKGLSEKDRLEADEKHQAEIAKSRDHPKVHHPGSEKQLQQAWENEGFDPDTFNVETFFHLQDHNQDGQLDAGEIEGMLVAEVEKMHHDAASAEYHEELLRMRQHVVHEVDKNRDGMISMAEYLDSTKLKSFAEDEAWKGVDYDEDYTDEEFDEYEKLMEEQRRQHEQQLQGGEHGDQLAPAGGQEAHHQPIADANVGQEHQAPVPGHQEAQPPHQEQQPPHHEQQQQQQQHEQQQQQPPPHHEQQQQQHHEQQQQQQQHHEQQQQQQHHEQQQQQQHEQQQQQQPPHHEQQQQPPQPPHHEQQQQEHHEQQQQQQPPQHEQQQQQPPHHEQQQQQPHEQQQPHHGA